MRVSSSMCGSGGGGGFGAPGGAGGPGGTGGRGGGGTGGTGGAGGVGAQGGSGGTGTFGIQIAKALGCLVTVSCSAKNVDLCRELGADEVLDYTSQDVTATLKAKGAGAFRLVRGRCVR